MRVMSLRYALLGLLDAHPASGYDLSRRFAAGIGAYAWDAKHSQIYPELKKLVDAELITVAERGPRGRKTYAITASGRSALRDWLLRPPTAISGVRNEFVLRLFLLPSLQPDEATGMLRHAADFAAEQLQILSGEYADATEDPATARSSTLAAQYGIYMYRATQDWAEWAIKQIEADAADTTAERAI